MKRTLKRESKVLEIAGSEGMASSIGLGNFRASVCGPIGSQLALLSLRRGLWSGREPVLSPGLGQDGFAVVENGVGKVAVSSRGRSYRPGQIGLPEIEVRKPTSAIGGWGSRAMVGRCHASCNASRRCLAASVRSAYLCAFGILTKWLSFARLETRTKESTYMRVIGWET